MAAVAAFTERSDLCWSSRTPDTSTLHASVSCISDQLGFALQCPPTFLLAAEFIDGPTGLQQVQLKVFEGPLLDHEANYFKHLTL